MMKAQGLLNRISLAILAILVSPSVGHAAGLANGQYHFQILHGPVCPNGTYPLVVGDMTSGCSLEAKVDGSGNLQGILNLRTLKGPISGTLRSDNGNLVLQLATTGQDVSQTPTQIQAVLRGSQFVGTATTSKGTVPASLDISSVAPLVVSFDVTLTVNTNGTVSGSGTAKSCSTTIPVQVTGTNATDKCALHIVGTNLPAFVWDGSGRPTYTGFIADYSAALFGVSGTGTGVMVGPTATAPALLANISTRLPVQTGDNVLIGGFIITGTQPKKLIVRAIGPSLPLAGKLLDPQLELHDSTGAILATNDNWQDAANKQAIIDSMVAPSNSKEAAILTSLSPGAYTAIVRGANTTTGIAVVEAYDLDRTADSRLANISTRGFVQSGDNVLIGGFILLGNAAQRVVVRAIGPSLPVANKLADPTLELHDPNGGLLSANDNWITDNALAIMATQVAPTNKLEAAIVATLLPGPYTAVIRGANGGTGVAVVEVYGLQP